MRSNCRIEGPPNAIATLEIPIDREHGRIQASIVERVQGSRKRKRSEIAIAVDNNAIQIYDLVNPRQLSSYHVSHETYFITSPCSTYQRKSSELPAKRRTYVVACDAPPHGRRYVPSRIECYTEVLKEDEIPEPVKTSYEFERGTAEVTDLAIVPVAGADKTQRAGYDVLATLDDGTLFCFDEDMQSVRWTWRPTSHITAEVDTANTSNITVEFASLVDSAAALRGLLAGREDAQALLSLHSNASQSPPANILILVYKHKHTQDEHSRRHVDLISIPQRLANQTRNVISTRRLLTWDIPTIIQPTSQSAQPSQYMIHASSGTLHILGNGSISKYDLSGAVPVLAATLDGSSTPYCSFTRVAHNTILANSATTYGLYDVKYNALLDAQVHHTSSFDTSNTRKRKRISSALRHTFQYVQYFPDLDFAAGLSGNEVMVQQLATPFNSKRRKATGNLLIDVMRKGTRGDPASILGQQQKKLGKHLIGPWSENTAHWQAARGRLDAVAAQGNASDFDQIFGSYLGAEFETASAVEEDDTVRQITNGTTNGHNGSPLRDTPDESFLDDESPQLVRWHASSSRTHAGGQHQIQASYALGKMFERSLAMDGSSAELRIRLFPTNVYNWLLSRNALSADRVDQALRQTISQGLSVQPLTSEDVVNALVKADPTLQAVCDLLTVPSNVDLDLVLAAMKALMNSLDESLGGERSNALATETAAKMITNGTSGAADDEVDDEEIDKHLSLANADLNLAETTLQHGMALRSVGLRSALTHLRKHAKGKVTKALREQLNTREIIFLIQILRIELDDGGWTSRYVDAGPTGKHVDQEWQSHHGVHSDYSPADGSVVIVAGLLSCAVDAIGLAGWLWTSTQGQNLAGQGLDEGDTAELLSSLRNEISAALQGIHEIKFIREFLAEYLQYNHVLKDVRPPTVEQQEKDNEKAAAKGSPVRPITAMTSKQFGEEGEMQRELASALPLGARSLREEVQPTKQSRGAQRSSKSVRQLGLEKSKLVGQYSIERIRI